MGITKTEVQQLCEYLNGTISLLEQDLSMKITRELRLKPPVIKLIFQDLVHFVVADKPHHLQRMAKLTWEELGEELELL